MKKYKKGDKVTVKRCYEIAVNGYDTQICPGEVGTADYDFGDEVRVWFRGFIALEVKKSDIEPIPEKETAELEGWVACDQDGVLRLFSDIPRREFFVVGFWEETWHNILLPEGSFPSVTWQSEPKKVRIRLEGIEE